MDRKKCTEKCLNSLHINSFIQIDHDSKKRLKRKLKGLYVKSRTTWLSKNRVGFIQQVYHLEGKFYGTVKRCKFKNGSTVDDQSLTAIISNIGTASYQMVKYLAKCHWLNRNIQSAVPKNLLTWLRMKEFQVHIKWYCLMYPLYLLWFP